MEIPADGYVIEAHELTTDESAMTGETGRIVFFIFKILFLNFSIFFIYIIMLKIEPVKKCDLKKCLIVKNRIIEEGNRNSSGRHEVPSCIIMSGTRIRKIKSEKTMKYYYCKF
jgi:hypothetical protein